MSKKYISHPGVPPSTKTARTPSGGPVKETIKEAKQEKVVEKVVDVVVKPNPEPQVKAPQQDTQSPGQQRYNKTTSAEARQQMDIAPRRKHRSGPAKISKNENPYVFSTVSQDLTNLSEEEGLSDNSSNKSLDRSPERTGDAPVYHLRSQSKLPKVEFLQNTFQEQIDSITQSIKTGNDEIKMQVHKKCTDLDRNIDILTTKINEVVQTSNSKIYPIIQNTEIKLAELTDKVDDIDKTVIINTGKIRNVQSHLKKVIPDQPDQSFLAYIQADILGVGNCTREQFRTMHNSMHKLIDTLDNEDGDGNGEDEQVEKIEKVIDSLSLSAIAKDPNLNKEQIGKQSNSSKQQRKETSRLDTVEALKTSGWIPEDSQHRNLVTPISRTQSRSKEYEKSSDQTEQKLFEEANHLINFPLCFKLWLKREMIQQL